MSPARWLGSRGRGRPHLGVVLALLGAAGGLAACGPNSNGATTQVVTASAGCQGGRIVGVGASLDLSGAGAAVGQAYLTGLEMGIAKVNRGGGVPGHNSCLELLYKDNRGSPAVDSEAMLNLVNAENALAVVGSYAAPSANGTAYYLHALSVPVPSFSTNDATFNPKRFPDSFPMTTSVTVQAQVMATFAAKQALSPVAVVVVHDLTGRQGAAAFSTAATSDGVEVAGRASVSPSGGGATAALTTLQADHPKALVVIDDGDATPAILAARAKLGWRVPVIAGPQASEVSAVEAAGAGGLAGVWAVVPSATVRSSGPAAGAAVAFRNQVLAKLGVSQLTGSIIPYAQAYDAITMFGSAATGTMDTLSGDLKTFLENANYQGVLASYSYTTGRHTGIAENQLSVVPVSTLSNGLFTYKLPKKAKHSA
ncbi:MAG TPA: ABC transporter substrate-binding protein [Acidimicrobiales bacterium]|nr:ABC transporter substrate-binding protein [Acidimicrobiales bacterium]